MLLDFLHGEKTIFRKDLYDVITTNKEVTCPGVSLVLSNINCPIRHINPQNINEYK